MCPRAVSALLALLSLSASGCAPSTNRGSSGAYPLRPDECAELTETGYYHCTLGYRIPSSNPHGLGFVSPDWSVTNFQLNRRPWQRKADPTTTVAFDDNNDGLQDATEDVRLYDLALVHRRSQARLEVRTTPMSGEWATADPRVIGRTWLAGLAHARVDYAETSGYVAVHLAVTQNLALSAGASATTGTVVEQRFNTRTIREDALTVDGRPAWAITFDFAEMNQLELSGGAAYRTARLVFVRTGLRWQHQLPRTNRKVRYPVLMVIAYSSQPDEFDRGLPSLESLIGQIDLDRR